MHCKGNTSNGSSYIEQYIPRSIVAYRKSIVHCRNGKNLGFGLEKDIAKAKPLQSFKNPTIKR